MPHKRQSTSASSGGSKPLGQDLKWMATKRSRPSSRRRTYSAASSPVRSYDPGKFTVLTSGIVAQPMYDRLPPEGRHIMDYPERYIYRSPAEIENLTQTGEIQPIYPYWDMVLRHSRAKRLLLFKQLMSAGL